MRKLVVGGVDRAVAVERLDDGTEADVGGDVDDLGAEARHPRLPRRQQVLPRLALNGVLDRRVRLAQRHRVYLLHVRDGATAHYSD